MLIETLKTLCGLAGVSGREDEVRDYILTAALPYAEEIITDPIGNLMIYKKGAREPEDTLMLCAHMDEIGIIVTSITDEGYLKFSFVGGVDRRVAVGRKVFLGGDKICGIIGIKAHHLVSKDEEKLTPKTEALYIDIGAKNKAEAEKAITLGDTGVFDGEAFELGGGLLAAKALDDRVGCAIMLELLKKPLPVSAWFCFTAQEEVGTRGALAAAYRLCPGTALVLEGTTAADIPGVAEAKTICRVGGGPVIPFMDGGAVYDKGLRRRLCEIADANGIKWQTKQLIAGGTDASAIQRSRAGVKTAALSVALRNIHSPVCVAKISDIEDTLALAELFLEAY
jgi:endoglucanase